MRANRHAAELRRKILVENPIIASFMEAEQRIEKLLGQLNREYEEVRKIVRYVKALDKTTSKVVAAGSRPKTKSRKTSISACKFDNVIPFPQKKSTKAA